MGTPRKHPCAWFNQGISSTESWKTWRASSDSFYWFSSLVLVLFLEFTLKIWFILDFLLRCQVQLGHHEFQLLCSVVPSSADLALRGGYCHEPETFTLCTNFP